MPPGVEVVGVTKTFESRRGSHTHAVGPIDLAVDDGEVVTLLGPSGCGKTTLLRMVAGLDAPTRGTITIHGRPPDAARMDKSIGWVPQAPALLPWRTVEGNARVLQHVNRRRTPAHPRLDTGELLDEVGLGDFRDAYPRELSGGMQQRVALVRALSLQPAVLLLDEPFAALDEISRVDARHLLARVCERHSTTVLFVTHSIAEAVYVSDRVVVMSSRPGRSIAIEPVTFDRPRRPDLEDDQQFFALGRRLRHHLHDHRQQPTTPAASAVVPGPVR